MSGVELAADDYAWAERALRSHLPVGHCGESTSEAIARGRAEDRVDRIIEALFRRAVPMEAGAWRSRYRPGNGDAAWTYHEREPSFLVGLKTDYEVQALAVIPAPGNKEDKQ